MNGCIQFIGDAILYTLNQEQYLRRYLEDVHLNIDNNSAERAVKNFAVGRRNWLFAKSIRGSGATAGAIPKQEDMKKLLPWSEEIPDECKTKLKK